MRIAFRAVSAVLAVAAALACGGSGTSKQVATDPGTIVESSDCIGDLPPNTFRLGGFVIQPTEIRVQAGTTVRWVHCGPEANLHSAVSDSGVFTSPKIGIGASYARTFDVVGEFPFHCSPHTTMAGKVIVDP